MTTTTALTAVGNKISNVCNLVKKTDRDTKINEIKNKVTSVHDLDKFVTTQNFNKLTSEYFAARLAKANLGSKNDIADFVNKTDFDVKLKKLNNKVTLFTTKPVFAENQLKNDKYLTQVFLLVRITLVIVNQKIT